MAILTSIAGTGPFVDVMPIAPGLALLLLFAGIVAAVIYAYQPPIPQSMVCAFVPWVVTGSFLHVLATSGRYPSYLVPVFAKPGAYLTAMFVPGLVWMVLLNTSVSRSKMPAFQHYIGVMGIGAMVILWSSLVLHLGLSALPRMLILVVVPLVTALATVLIALSIGLWSPDFVEYTIITGGFAVFGVFVNGIATVTTIVMSGPAGHTAFSMAIRDLVSSGVRLGWVVVDPTHLWVWLFLAANVGIAILIATRLAPHASSHPRAVHSALGLVGGVAFAAGFNDLLRIVVG